MMTFSKHENIDLDMLFTAYLSIWAVQKPIKNHLKIIKNHEKSTINKNRRAHINLKSDALAYVKQRVTQNAYNEKTENLNILEDQKSYFFVLLA